MTMSKVKALIYILYYTHLFYEPDSSPETKDIDLELHKNDI